MLKAFQNHLNINLPYLNESTFLVAVSGGLDSVVLTHLCYESKLDFVLAHCNFNLRAGESDADQDFVEKMADRLNAKLYVTHFETETYAKTNKCSVQMAARDLRYQWFYELAEKLGVNYVLTAHHLDDNLETFLINLSRGTGLDGLAGIPEVNGKVIRPLLPFSREDVLKYAKKNEMTWREDSSNASTKYLRNALRHKIIPVLKELNPQFLNNFRKTQEHLQSSKSIVSDRIEMVSKAIVSHKSESELHLDIHKIQELKHPKAYVYHLLKNYGFTEWNDVFNLLNAQSGKYVESQYFRVIKNRDHLIVCSNKKKYASHNTVKKDNESVELPIGTLTFKRVNAVDKQTESCIYVDGDKINFPLEIRSWEDGDHFQPMGMVGTKKISKYFKDEKLSLLEKEKALLLCSNDAIIWVITMRQDGRFAVTEKTQNILKIELT